MKHEAVAQVDMTVTGVAGWLMKHEAVAQVDMTVTGVAG